MSSLASVGEITQAVILGVVQGFTEFLPISSSGHLLLFGKFLHSPLTHQAFFLFAVQLATTLALALAYRERIKNLLTGLVSQDSQRRFALALILAMVPAMLVGPFLHTKLENRLGSVTCIATMLIIGGVAMIAVEEWLHWRGKRAVPYPYDAVHPLKGLGVGFAQCLAMVPGISRSGSTIMGGLLLGLPRMAAVEFSFFLSIPVSLGAALFALHGHVHLSQLSAQEWSLACAGFLSSFIVAALLCKLLILFVGQHSLALFGLYRILVGGLFLIFAGQSCGIFS